MHLRSVELFCDVAARRSFSKGAAAHNVSQSSASQTVNLLENRLGTLLIDRSKRPLELTPAGRIYYEGCRELLGKYRDLENAVRQSEDRVAGRVRVAAIYSVNLMQMEQSVLRFQQLYPEAEVSLAYLHPDEVYAQVLEDEADLGIVSFPRNGGEFTVCDWQQQPMVLVAPPAHRLAREFAKGGLRGGKLHSIAPQELDGEDFVGFTEELQIRKKIDRWLRRERVSVHIVHEFDNIENIKSAVKFGSGLALLPEPTVRQETMAGSLVAISLGGEPLFRPLGLVQRRNKPRMTAVQKWIDLLQQEAAAERVTDVSRSAGQRRLATASSEARDSGWSQNAARPSAGARQAGAKQKRKRG